MDDHTDKTTRELFHALWTKAVGTEQYDKKEWMELERRLGHLIDPPPATAK